MGDDMRRRRFAGTINGAATDNANMVAYCAITGARRRFDDNGNGQTNVFIQFQAEFGATTIPCVGKVYSEVNAVI